MMTKLQVQSMKIYYYANQVYQFSHALPIYRVLGGALISNEVKKIIQIKIYLRNINPFPDDRTILKTPRLAIRDRENLDDLDGIVISLSNATINCKHDRCKTIFIGHGTGDKKYGSTAANLEGYDYHFIAGPKHLAKLQDVGVDIPEEKLIKIGNPRFDDYINGKIDREKELDRLGVVDRSRKNVLYAPTWRWGGGTFKNYVYRFCEQITQKYNLIIRPHHHDRRYLPRLKLWAKLSGIRHVYFSNPTALVKSDTMNDFKVSDILISDTSSILYEYLITRQPIIVIRTDFKDLHHMPDEMNIMNYTTIYDGIQNIVQLIEEHLASQEYKEDYERLLHNCFYFNDGKSVERAVAFIKSLP